MSTAGSFVGDVSFTTGVPATATVVALETARVLAFDQARLKALCARDEQIASALYRRIGGGPRRQDARRRPAGCEAMPGIRDLPQMRSIA